MRALLRLAGVKEYLRSSLWVLPALFVVVALALGTSLSTVRPEVGTLLEPVVFGGTPAAARELLTTLAGAMITVTGLTFSLTVVALQMAAGQYSPRVLRGFLADRGNQLVLSSLVGTFAYTVAVLRNVRDETDAAEAALPELAVTVAVLFSLVALGMLVYFLHHLTRQLRVETILVEIAEDTMRTVDRIYADEPHPGPDRRVIPDDGGRAVRIPARRSGYLQAVERKGLIRMAGEADVVVRLRPEVGDHVTVGTTLAWVWRRDHHEIDEQGVEDLGDLVHGRVQLGPERTMHQDVEFGIRQIVDIGVKALSTGMNDPTTAVEAVAHLSAVMCSLATRDLGSAVDADEGQRVRLILPRPELGGYLDRCTDQLLRYGGGEPAVLLALLTALEDVAEVVVSSTRREDVTIQVERVLEVAARELDPVELAPVATRGAEVTRALAEGGRPQPDGSTG